MRNMPRPSSQGVNSYSELDLGSTAVCFPSFRGVFRRRNNSSGYSSCCASRIRYVSAMQCSLSIRAPVFIGCFCCLERQFAMNRKTRATTFRNRFQLE